MIALQTGQPITIYGDGKQVRDVLFIDDLLDAYEAAAANIERVAGRIYNVGGGPANAISLLDPVPWLESKTGRPVPVALSDWRYLAVSLLAGLVVFFWYPISERLRNLSNHVLIFMLRGWHSSPWSAHKRRSATDSTR